jgi:two-component system, cell cycle sensor histidine kinase and response regulator CckA
MNQAGEGGQNALTIRQSSPWAGAVAVHQSSGDEQRTEAVSAVAGDEQARAVLRLVPNSLLLGTDGTILEAHASLTPLLGHMAAELTGQPFLPRFLHPDELTETQEWLATLPVGSVTATRLLRLKHKAGVWLEVEAHGSRLPATILLLLRDVTPQRRTERLLRRGEERMRTFLELSEEGVWCCELDQPIPVTLAVAEQIDLIFQRGYMSECNNAMARMYGYARAEEIIGKRLDALLPADDPHNRAFLEAFIASGYQLRDAETHERDREGRALYFVNNLTGYVENGGLRRAWGMQQDITARRCMEEALRASESKYRQLVENLEQCIFLKDRQFRYAAVNRRFCLNLDKSEEDILGRTDFDLFPRHLAEKYRADDELVLGQHRRLEMEETTLIQGRPRTVRVIKTPVQDGLGHATGVLSIYWDVSEQRALEAHLRHAQKMDAIGQLAQGVAHDFNNMLTGILGSLDLAMRSLPEGEPCRDLLQTAEHAAQRAGSLVRRLMSFSQRRRLRLETLGLGEGLQESLELLRHTLDARVTLNLRFPSTTWQVQGDRDQLNQVVMNLGLNARDAMPDGGTLAIAASNVLVTEEYARRQLRARPGEFVCLKVSDTGNGIPEEVRPRLFEPFVTTKGADKGLGLGLALAFGIVEQHRGWIDCETATGKGTAFSVYLPRDVSPLAPMAPPQATPTPSRGHETVLLAEDESILRQLGSTILERYGYRVLVAEDGQQAVELFTQLRDRIDLVILDLSMPRLSGQEACVKLREMKPDVRVMFTSGFTEELLALAEEGDAHGYLGKPYRPEELAAAVRAAIDGSAPRVVR